MGIPPILNVCRHGTDNRAQVTLTGENDLQSVPSVPARTPSSSPEQLVTERRAPDGAVLLTPVLPLGVRTAVRLEGLDHRSWTRW